MKTLGVRMEWVGEAEEVAVAGEFNGWVTVPLDRENLSLEEAQLLFPQATDPPATLWTVLLQMEPGNYAFKFLVDGEWKTREEDELEEDEKGELNAFIIVEEEEEDEEESSLEEVKAAAAVQEAVERVEEDLDVLTLNISLCEEKSFMEMTGKNEGVPDEKEEAKMEMIEEEAKVKTVEEDAKKKTIEEESNVYAVVDEENIETVEKETVKEEGKVETGEKEANIKTVNEEAKVETVNANPKDLMVNKDNIVEDKENTPKVDQEAPPKRMTRRSILPGTPTLPNTPKVGKEVPPKRVTRRSILPGTPTLTVTPKVSTPTLRASKLDKVVKEKTAPEDVESPRRLTRTALKNVKKN